MIMGYTHISTLKESINTSTSPAMKERIENQNKELITDNVKSVLRKRSFRESRNTPNYEPPSDAYFVKTSVSNHLIPSNEPSNIPMTKPNKKVKFQV